MGSYVTEAIVTGARRYGEADRLITLLTLDRGRKSAIAKSARKAKSKFAGSTETFIKAKFELAEGRSLDIVRHAEVISANLALRENWTRLQLAGHVAEIANKMGEEGVPDPQLYHLLDEAISGITEDRIGSVLIFKVGVLSHMGIFPDLGGCVECGKTRATGQVHLDISRDGFLCSDCASERHIYQPVQMEVLYLLHSINRGDGFGDDVSKVAIESAEDVLTVLLQGFLQAGFKTVKAARHARNSSGADTNDDKV